MFYNKKQLVPRSQTSNAHEAPPLTYLVYFSIFTIVRQFCFKLLLFFLFLNCFDILI
jgi:hypothetical protein